MSERNCENCANVHCYRFTPKYELCKNGSLWQPYRNKRTKEREFRKQITKQMKEIKKMSEIEKLNIIAEWQEQHKQLTEDLNNSKKRIVELEKENEELKKESDFYHREKVEYKCAFFQKVKETIILNKQLVKAKEIIKRLLKATYGEGWNYSLQVKVEAEKFLKESE